MHRVQIAFVWRLYVLSLDTCVVYVAAMLYILVTERTVRGKSSPSLSHLFLSSLILL